MYGRWHRRGPGPWVKDGGYVGPIPLISLKLGASGGNASAPREDRAAAPRTRSRVRTFAFPPMAPLPRPESVTGIAFKATYMPHNRFFSPTQCRPLVQGQSFNLGHLMASNNTPTLGQKEKIFMHVSIRLTPNANEGNDVMSISYCD